MGSLDLAQALPSADLPDLTTIHHWSLNDYVNWIKRLYCHLTTIHHWSLNDYVDWIKRLYCHQSLMLVASKHFYIVNNTVNIRLIM